MKNQTFGIELEMRHISRADAAAVIAAHFGTRVSHTGGGYDTREIPDGTGRVWKVVKDASIADDWDHQTEVVSPICHWDDIETVQRLPGRRSAALSP